MQAVDDIGAVGIPNLVGIHLQILNVFGVGDINVGVVNEMSL